MIWTEAVLVLIVLGLISYIFYNNRKIHKDLKELESSKTTYEQIHAKSTLTLRAVRELGAKERELTEKNQMLLVDQSEKQHEIELLEQQMASLEEKKKMIQISSAELAANLEQNMITMTSLKEKEYAEKVADMERHFSLLQNEIEVKKAEIEQEIASKKALVEAINEQLTRNTDKVQRIELPRREYFTFKEAMSGLGGSLPASFTTAMNKVLWTELVRRPTSEMVKRLTRGNKVSGIYKITNTETGYSYIGRSVDVGNRLTEHIRSAVGASSTTQQQVHKEMGNNLLDWTFEMLEQVPEEKLSEREKFYIDFYDTTNVGYNRVRGG